MANVADPRMEFLDQLSNCPLFKKDSVP